MRLPQSWVVIFSLLVVGPWWSVSGQHNFDHEQALKRKANIYRRARQVKGRQKHVDRELGAVSTVDQVKEMTSQASNFFGSTLPGMASNVNADEAAYLFENFKILEQMKSYKAFSDSGSKDATELATAQQASVKEFITMMASVGSKVATTNGLNATIAEFLQGARDDSSLRQLMEDVRSGADPSATHKLQQAFADKYMGGIDLNTLYDNSFVEASRKRLMEDTDLQRIIGDSDVIRTLLNPRLVMKRPDLVTPEETDDLLKSLMTPIEEST